VPCKCGQVYNGRSFSQLLLCSLCPHPVPPLVWLTAVMMEAVSLLKRQTTSIWGNIPEDSYLQS
jgi:hypothetical protein